MGVLLGAIAAIAFGTSDYLAAVASRTNHPIAVTRTALAAALVFTPLFLALRPFSLTPADVVYSVISGIVIGTALVVLYVGYTKAPIDVIAPVASVVTALVPVLLDLARGNTPRALGVTGIVVGVTAVALCTIQRNERGPTSAESAAGRPAASRRTATLFGLAAGTCTGTAFSLMALTSNTAGLAPVPIQRISGLVFLAVISPLIKAPTFAAGQPARMLAVTTGLAAGLGMGLLQLAYRWADAGPVTVAGSQYAAVTVLVAAGASRRRLDRWQSIGVALASVAVALMAIG